MLFMQTADDVHAVIGSGRLRCLLQVLHELAAAVSGTQHGRQHFPSHWSHSTQHSGGQRLWFHDAHGYSHAGGLCLTPGADPWLVDLGLLDWYTLCDVCLYVCVCLGQIHGWWIWGYWIATHPVMSVHKCVYVLARSMAGGFRATGLLHIL